MQTLIPYNFASSDSKPFIKKRLEELIAETSYDWKPYTTLSGAVVFAIKFDSAQIVVSWGNPYSIVAEFDYNDQDVELTLHTKSIYNENGVRMVSLNETNISNVEIFMKLLSAIECK